MRIFNNETVVGLFDNDKAAEDAIKALQKQGFGEEDGDKITIVDQNRLAQETPASAGTEKVVVPPPTGSSRVTPPVTISESIERRVMETLTGIGIDHEEASFFARHVGRGNTLLIVETSEERAAQALDVMKQFGVQSSTS